MPFGLKNTGATYQRLMDRVFERQVGRNMEAYVDDMIVKSVLGSSHHEDLTEDFGRLRKHNMKLNPEKCCFGIQGGKFLGFMITSRGIEINLDKCRAIQEMKSPSIVKEVQRLTGRIATLSRFLPHSSDKSAPFFKCLKKNAAFQWSSECEEAFKRLKEMLFAPPVLSKPAQGLPLHLYFSVSDHAISSVILQVVDGEQKIVYFVSHTLQRAEIRYQKIEKAALVVLVTARHIRPYFQSFQVKVRTDLPLRQVLQKPDLPGRLVAWSVELSEYGLQYDKRGKVGAHTFFDFMVELTPEDGEKVSTQWTLFVDGSSNDNESGAGVTLQGPRELVLEQSLIFQFKASNNQAEYEALIVGLKLAIEVQIDSLLVGTDSLLVANQVNGEFQVKEPALIKYLERVRLLMGRLQEVVVEFVPRAQNQRADALAKLASTRKPGNNRSVIQETLANPSIEEEFVASVDRPETWMDPIVDILAREPSARTAPRFEGENSANMEVELDLLSETHDEARIREAAMKQRAAANYDLKVRPRAMQEGDLVLKKRIGSSGNKLRPIWEGPYIILKALGKGAYHLESLDGRRVPRSWNAASLKYYYS
ncbi:uncharacterized protein LOC130736649 [Lotus japonicus]|uniref:uncharacterized protein LOC130736649 n=1 Tax=Lotus japonicus TaxID=34305 RepID=UPI0025869925|nr:uncharacterized protein LOC130736649 [Lotus japonicus]